MPPLVLIVDDEAVNRQFATLVLERAGWRVAGAASGEEALAMTGIAPALVLMDINMPGLDGVATAAAMRRRGGTWASAPIVAFTTMRPADPATLLARGFDDYLAKPCSPEGLVAAAARWLPGEAGTITRLEARLGAAELRPVVDGFRAMLQSALRALEDGDAAGVAHRVAGIAGTLGFGAVGRGWLALSEGEAVDRVQLRRSTRRAIAEIDRRHAVQDG